MSTMPSLDKGDDVEIEDQRWCAWCGEQLDLEYLYGAEGVIAVYWQCNNETCPRACLD